MDELHGVYGEAFSLSFTQKQLHEPRWPSQEQVNAHTPALASSDLLTHAFKTF